MELSLAQVLEWRIQKSQLNCHPPGSRRDRSHRLLIPGLAKNLLKSAPHKANAGAAAEPDPDDPRLHALGRKEEREVLPVEGQEGRQRHDPEAELRAMDRQEVGEPRSGRRGLQAQKVPTVGGKAIVRRLPNPRGALRHHAAHDTGAEQA